MAGLSGAYEGKDCWLSLAVGVQPLFFFILFLIIALAVLRPRVFIKELN